MRVPATMTIRIDPDVYRILKAHARPLVDTPNSVLRRLLNLEPQQTPTDPTTRGGGSGITTTSEQAGA
ncbi:MAG TPA: hypothetical protein VKZ50_02670 [bacterium]|nr:hypothetical protein [bacterium]